MKTLSQNRILYLCLLLICGNIISGCAQKIPLDKPSTLNPAFDKKISSLISFDISLISVAELKKKKEKVVLLDAREFEEFQVSHIEGAQYIGYQDFQEEALKNIPKNSEIVLYCSIGYRSEKVGEKLEKLGYSKVYNLYGSIFEWVNQGNPVVDQNEKPTQVVHGYNKSWSKWLDSNKVKKIW